MNGKTSCIHGLEDLILLRWECYPKQSTDLMQSLSKSQWHFFFKERENFTIKFIWYIKGLQIAQTVLKKNKVGGLLLPDFETYYKVTIIKKVWYWRAAQKGADICILMADSHCVWQKPTQCCKAIILQIKLNKYNNFFKKERKWSRSVMSNSLRPRGL